MKALNVLTLVIALAALGLSGYLFQQGQETSETQLGFVRTGVLMDRTNLTLEAREKLEAEQATIEGNAKTLEDELKTMHETFIGEEKGLSKEDREARIRDLAKKEAELDRYKYRAQQMLQQKEMEIMEPVLATINGRIANYATENGYTLIWGTLQQGNILYGEPGVDVTEDVIKYINAKK